METYQGKHVLVVGMARSGIAAAALLAAHGAIVTINDNKTEAELGEALAPLQGQPVIRKLGCSADSLLEGQDMLILSPGIPDKAAFVVEARKKGVRVEAEIELAYQLSQGDLVAVTGTNGKTTTVTLLDEIFLASGRTSRAVGNIGFPYSQAVAEGHPGDMYVCECSSFQMETVHAFHPHAAALLNITEDHLNRHGTMEEYTRLKMRIFENQTLNDYAIFNGDDPALKGLPEKVQSHVLFFSRQRELEEGAFVRNGHMILRLSGQETDVIPVDEIYIPGPHNLENALAASLMAFVCGVHADVIADTLRRFRGVEHRIEWTREYKGITYYNDSKGTNVDSTLRAVETMTKPTTIILGGSDKHCDFTPLARAMLDSPYIREAVLLGVTADQIEATLRREGYTHISRVTSMQEAVEKATALSSAGWNVLLSPACASFDMFHDYEERGRIFKQIVSQLKE
ncbi:MAG: UDP-N-acetylmuramoyl-L-alanine--D-glutamate ligase [Clostridia bacterium]|nr:UDP-N-acetylmuramoyl-L-alanine--D-glutamate ligase [Clostridia bacterium]